MGERVDARKARYAKDDALKLLKGTTRVVVARGRKVTTFDARKDDVDEIAVAMLGPTGNLRAPTIRVGTTLVVGFNEDAYRDALT